MRSSSVVKTLDDHADTVWGVAEKASGGRRMVSSCADGCLKLWECDGRMDKGNGDGHT